MIPMIEDAYFVVLSLGGLSLGLLLVEKYFVKEDVKIFGYVVKGGCIASILWFIKKNPMFGLWS